MSLKKKLKGFKSWSASETGPMHVQNGLISMRYMKSLYVIRYPVLGQSKNTQIDPSGE